MCDDTYMIHITLSYICLDQNEITTKYIIDVNFQIINYNYDLIVFNNYEIQQL